MTVRSLLFAVLACVSFAAAAHDDHVGPNDGYVKHLGPVEIEVVTRGAEVIVHVRDEKTGEPVSLSAEAGGRAVVLVAGKTESIPLKATGSTLQGTARAPIPETSKVALALRIPGRDDLPTTTFDLSRKASLPKTRPR